MAFVVGLVGCVVALHWLDRMPFWSHSRPKVAYLSQHLDEYDTLFVGSSRVNNGVVPGVFDARLAELGIEARSFNVAVNGSRPHDFDNIIDWVLEQRAPGLRRIFVELHAHTQVLRDGEEMSDLAIEAHTLPTLWQRLRSIQIDTRKREVCIDATWQVVRHTVANVLRIGQGARMARDVAKRMLGLPPNVNQAVWDAGWQEIAPDKVQGARLQPHYEFVGNPEAAARDLAKKTANLVPEEIRGGFDLNAWQAQKERLEAAGLEVVYIVMPEYSKWFRGRDAIAEIRERATVLELDQPKKYPNLFRFEFYFDKSHVLRAGAYAVSYRLAEAYAEQHK